MYLRADLPSPCANCKRLHASSRNVDDVGVNCPKQLKIGPFKPRKKRCKYQIKERE